MGLNYSWLWDRISRNRNQKKLICLKILPETPQEGGRLTSCQNGGISDFWSVFFFPVTAAIYQNGEEKLAMRWSFEIATDGGIKKRLYPHKRLIEVWTLFSAKRPRISRESIIISINWAADRRLIDLLNESAELIFIQYYSKTIVNMIVNKHYT